MSRNPTPAPKASPLGYLKHRITDHRHLPLLRSQPRAGARRLFGIIPNYRSDQAGETYKPLSTAEKYAIALQG